MAELLDLVNSENSEDVPEILPVDARLSVSGSASKLAQLFERGASVAPQKEVIVGTSFSLFESFDAEAGTTAYVQLTTTDGKVSLVVVSDGYTVRMAGAVLLPAKRVLEILKLVPVDGVRIEVLGNTCTIRSGQAVWTVQTPVGNALPPLPDTSSIVLRTASVQSFSKALGIVRKAMSTSTARSSMMQLQVKAGVLTALDGARVHQIKLSDFPLDVAMKIPSQVVEELAKALHTTNSTDFELGGDDYRLAFRIDQDILVAQELLLNFPNAEDMIRIPTIMNEHHLEVEREALIDIVKRVRVNADPDYLGIYLGLTFKAGANGGEFVLTVRARDKNGNAAQESLSAREFTGPKTAREAIVNHRHLLELLASATSDYITIRLADDAKGKKNSLLLIDGSFTGVLAQMMPNWTR